MSKKKTDFKRQNSKLYSGKVGRFDLVNVPPMNFLMIDGDGGPVGESYPPAIAALYALSYGMKFFSKIEMEKDYVVGPLEGLWWADDMNTVITREKDQWKWTMMIRQPDWLLREHLDQGQAVRAMKLDDDQLALLKELHLLTIKPTMYIANVSEDGFDNNSALDQVNTLAEKEGAAVVVICASIESEIAELEETEKLEFLEDLGIEEPGLNRVIRSGYSLLGLQTYFTAGVKEVRAWTVKVGATAPEGAGVIHTDFQKGFIRAEVVGYDDFVEYNGEQGAKDAGKWRLEGKDYIIKDGDVMHFRFNV